MEDISHLNYRNLISNHILSQISPIPTQQNISSLEQESSLVKSLLYKDIVKAQQLLDLSSTEDQRCIANTLLLQCEQRWNSLQKGDEDISFEQKTCDLYIFDDIFKSEQDELKKGRSLPTGTIKSRGDRKYIKTSQGWKYYSEGGKSSNQTESSQEQADKDLVNGKITEVEHDKITTVNKQKQATQRHIDVMNSGKTEIEADKAAKQSSKEDELPKVGSHVSVVNHRDLPSSLFKLGGQKLEVVGTERGTLTVPKFLQVKDKNGDIHLINPNYVTKSSISPKINPTKQSKKELYEAVNAKYGTKFKAGDIDEFEDDSMRNELTQEDIKDIVDAERENNR